MSRLATYLIVGVATLIGSTSLFAFFGLFLFIGSPRWVDIELGEAGALAFDALLCVVFFVQHSGMVRRGYQRWSSRLVPTYCHGAVYTIASGVALLALVAFWQESQHTLLSVGGGLRLGLRAVFCLGVLGFAWGILALGSFDTLGLKPVLNHLRKVQPAPMPLTVRGPYRWVRHALYLFCLMMIWPFPEITADRLLFNVLFTIWIVVGTVLEERDLAAAFGDAYRDYQRAVPMLFPRSLRPLA